MSPTLSRHAIVTITAGGLVLFLGIGMRQGFGLFFNPVAGELQLSREAFARTVALQYLMFGLAGPIAGLIAERTSARVALGLGALMYASGFASASLARNGLELLVSAGLLLGTGVGFIHFGVVNAAVSAAVPTGRRGGALGSVAAICALGQLLLLGYTQLTIDLFGWRGSMQAHAALLLLIVPMAWLLGRSSNEGVVARQAANEPQAIPLRHALRMPTFWLLAVGFGFSGLHVMFTMTHLPALVADLGLAPGHAVAALAAVSGTSFVGSWIFGRLCDRLPSHRLLAFIYAARAGLALVAAFIVFNPVSLVAYFLLLGLVWMCTMPVTSHLTAQLFGVATMASVYGAVFLVHQIGGFAGTWLGGIVFDHTGSYRFMWLVAAGLCAVAALLALRLGKCFGPSAGVGDIGSSERRTGA
jgi:predicted MFS family arabinose efflux permease